MDGKPDYLDDVDDNDFQRLVEEARRKDRGVERSRRQGPDGARPNTRLGPPVCIELLSSAAIAPIAIRWLWREWLAESRLQILAGAPGAGKTTIAIRVAATVSTGSLWPDGTRSPAGNVVIWSGEDDPADTLIPRLEAAGTDLKRVFIVGRAREDGAARPFDPARDMPALADALKKAGDVKLLIIDPVAMVAVKDSHRNAETRRDLQPLVELCRETGAAVLGIHHFAKGSGGREPQERLIGSVAFAAVARLVWVVARVQAQDGQPARNVVMRAKSNIGPDDGGFAYTITQVELEKHQGVCASRVDWGARIEGCARDILAAAERPDEDRSPRGDAADFLKAILASGPIPVDAILAAARKEGIAEKTLKRAKTDLGVNSVRTGFGPGSKCHWALQASERPIEGHDEHRWPLKPVAPYGEGDPLWEGKGTGEDHVEVEI
jgi:putative DNA primase/helicase